MEIKRKVGNRFAISPDGLLFKVSNGEILPEDEPLFLMRARDHLAVESLVKYRALAERDGCNDYFLGLLNDTLKEFLDFAATHPEKIKQPGVTRGR